MEAGTSREIAASLMRKIQDANDGRNLVGAETMCRCVDTLIRLARLEMDYARMRNEKPSVPYLANGRSEIDKAVDTVAAKLKGTW